MDKLKIGIVVNFKITPDSGGTYSYTQTLLKALNEYSFDKSIEICNVVFDDKNSSQVNQLKQPTVFIPDKLDVRVAPKKYGWHYLLNTNPATRLFLNRINRKNQKIIEKKLQDNGIHLLFFIQQFAFDINYPFIINHWDLAHKTTYPFPEITLDGVYEYRNNHFSTQHNKALFVLCESRASIQEVQHYLSISAKKLKFMPIFGSSAIAMQKEEVIGEMLKKYTLEKDKFFLYPAQFWALKNHYNLILAFKEFLEKGEKNFKLVLIGADQGNRVYIEALIDELSLRDNVVFTGFISDAVLSALYQSATALVFPSFLGPTNMPLLEAAKLHCPVLCSNLEGHKEQMQSHALYFEPTKIEEIVEAMLLISKDEVFRKELIKSAYEHVLQSEFNLENSLSLLNTILLEAKAIRKTWGINYN